MSGFWSDSLDPNERERVEEALRYFYEDFSAGVRKKLISKNLISPISVYDVLYPKTREALLAKNVEKEIDLEESSKSIRDALIAKLVVKQTDLENLSEDVRKSLLARNKILTDANDLLDKSWTIRKNLLAKNVPADTNLLKDSDTYRDNNMAKNAPDPNADKKFENSNNTFRDNNVAKNVPGNITLDTNSEEFRKNNIHKNVDNPNVDLDKLSKNFREDSLAKNINRNIDSLDDIANAQRNILLSKNNPDDKTDKLGEMSSEFRENNIAHNVEGTTTIDSTADAIRKNNLAANTEKQSDLEKDSEKIRKQNLANNTNKVTDLGDISAPFREDAIAKNTPKDSDLERDSQVTRDNNISANTSKTTNLEEMSEEFRKNNLSNNNEKTGDLVEDSDIYRKNNLSSNKPNGSDLLIDSEVFIKNNLSANKPNESDLLDVSKEFLKNNLSPNKPNGSDLVEDSKDFLDNNLSSNKPKTSDLLDDSKPALDNNLSFNKPKTSDLITDSEPYLDNNLSANNPKVTDLISDSEPFLDNNLSANTPKNSDLLTDSETYLANNLAPNVPGSGDLLTDSAPYLTNNLAPNVPGGGDLLTDSAPYLTNNLAPNVPGGGDLLTDSAPFLNDNLAPNVPSGGDLLTDSAPFLNNNLAPNVPSGGDLLTDSGPIRDANISHNQSNPIDLEDYSKPFRNNNLAANPPSSQLGVVVEGIGTATFLGVSRVLTQGILLRQVLLAKNKKSKYNLDNFISYTTFDKTNTVEAKNALIAKNEFQLNTSEYSESTALGLTSGKHIGYYGKDVSEEIQKGLDKIAMHARTVGSALQLNYGTNDPLNEYRTATVPQKVGGGFFSTSSVSPKGGDFLDYGNAKSVSFNSNIFAGSITDAIRNYNLSRNLYNLYKIIPGNLESMTTLKNNNDEGFQDLLAKTIGKLSGNDSIGSQLQGNLVPRSILVANEGAYIKGGAPENILRPQQAQGMQVGSPESMMSKTVAGNPLMDTEFQAGTKGVVHVLNTIKNSDASKFSVNFDPQNNKKYVIGTNNDGTPKFARQRFTIANPYSPGKAKSLIFYLKNYSSGQEFYFPPYIQNYSDSYGVNWNSINFLGRPEAVFTYNNSTREGTISFVVLTDYTQNLVIGHNFADDSMSEIKVNPKGQFTARDVAQNKQRELAFNEGEAKQKEVNNTKKTYQEYNNIVSGGTPESNVLQKNIDDLQKQSNSIQKTQEDALISSNKGNVYSESNNTIGNINNFMTSVPSREMGNYDSKAEDSKKRIDEMIKNLAFQPSFFSGDKVDFITKMEFLAKMTRPAKADEGSGFSFTRPPICHIHLGDWWNNDIVVDNVNFSYDDVPWTLDEGRVQPMWAVVTMNFKFIGPYRTHHGGPVLSDDKGGFYQNRTE